MSAVDELWAVTRSAPQVDAAALARAVEDAVASDSLDHRSRLLIRDSVRALENHWGKTRFEEWLDKSLNRQRIQRATAMAGSEEIAFPYLEKHVVDAIRAETVIELLRELSLHVEQPVRIVIGGSIALVLSGHLVRYTQDIDIVDELPAPLRNQHELLDELARRYGLRLTHFQSHYLPSGWEQRVGSVGVFGKLQVFAVDAYDVFVGKLFSARDKDRDDLRALKPRLDHETLIRCVRETTASLRSDARLTDAAGKNWFILFGEQLPG